MFDKKAWTKTNRTQLNEQSRAWAKANPKKVRASSATWRAANSEKENAARAAWRAVNPERHKATQAENERRRRARRMAQLCTCCVPWTLKFIYQQAQSLSMEVDHKRPLAKGGLHCLRNLQLLEPVDNMRKGVSYGEV